MEITDHKLDGVSFVESPNHGPRLLKGERAIVIHYTAGPSLTRAVSTLTDPRLFDKNGKKRSRVSAHTATGPDGKCTQLVPFSHQAWHAGTSSWQGRPSLNKWSYGLEVVNPGWLDSGHGDGVWQTYWGAEILAENVLVAAHKHGGPVRGWAKFPDAQVASVYAQCAALCDYDPSIRWLLGHDDVAPGRKMDPGPAFPMAKLRGWLGLGGPSDT